MHSVVVRHPTLEPKTLQALHSSMSAATTKSFQEIGAEKLKG